VNPADITGDSKTVFMLPLAVYDTAYACGIRHAVC